MAARAPVAVRSEWQLRPPCAHRRAPPASPSPCCRLLAKASASDVGAAAERILAAMLRLNVSRNACTPPACEEHLRRNVTSDAHVALAREAATASIVLLKNEGPLLPLAVDKVKSIAIIGAAAVGPIFDPNGAGQGGGPAGSWNTGDYYSGGGSGHVVAPNSTTVTAYEGIARRAAAAGIKVIHALTNDISAGVAAAGQADVTIVVGGTSSGEAMDRANLSLDDGADALISAVAKAAPGKVVVLTQVCGAILTPWRDDVAAALVLFLGGQQTGAAWGAVLFGDHSPTGKLPITLPSSEIETIAPSSEPTVPYTEGMATGYRNISHTPAFPFGHGLSYTCELPALNPETSSYSPSHRLSPSALAFGSRLPFCSAHPEARGIETRQRSHTSLCHVPCALCPVPCTLYPVPCSPRGPEIETHQCTAFHFGDPRVSTCDDAKANLCVAVDVTNTGGAPGATVAQLYLRFPPAAQHPSKLLKGFEKTSLLSPAVPFEGKAVPAAKETLTFRLTPRDRSYYDAATAQWVQVRLCVACGRVRHKRCARTLRAQPP